MSLAVLSFSWLEIEDISLTGQIIATRHLLSVVADTLGIELGEEEND